MKYHLFLIPLLVIVVISPGCISSPPATDLPSQQLNHTLMENWALLPNTSAGEKAVDVFYLYPTLFRTLNVDSMNTSDPAFRQDAVCDVMMKKGVFEEKANVYAPFYPQTGLDSMVGNGTWTHDQYVAEKLAYEDVKAAFFYYIDHYNDGKPLILDGHSQ